MEQNELSAERISFIKYKNLCRDLRLKAPSFDEYGNGIGVDDLTKMRIEAESLNQQVNGKLKAFRILEPNQLTTD